MKNIDHIISMRYYIILTIMQHKFYNQKLYESVWLKPSFESIKTKIYYLNKKINSQ